MPKFYVTTPIYYVNDRPHIGHAYATTVADVLARYHKLRGAEVAFVTGTDENAQKTVDAALKGKEDALSYTNRMAEAWKSVWQALGISNTDFIRTTESRHKEAVGEVWRRIWGKGDIYKGKYEGLYCKGHEAFMKQGELVDGLCPDHQSKPELVSEENYFFRLSKYQPDLLKFYEDNPGFVMPHHRFNEVKAFVTQGLEDISVSRETRSWGIPVPNDPKQVVYVWFDALINYISAVGLKEWQEHPADVHVIGKDIVRFHAVIWPAMLMSAGLPLPKQEAVSGFFTINGVKISKSLGNAIDPLELKKIYGVDAIRYFFLREIPFGEDGDFSESKLRERYNADLANGLGNFAARVATLAEKIGVIDLKTGLEPEVGEKVNATREMVNKKIVDFKFHEAVAAIWELIAFGDAYVNEKKPWETNDAKAIFNLVVVLDNIAGLLAPFLPQTTAAITACIRHVDGKVKVKKCEALFPRLA